jgi:hypothetical protein
MNGLLNPLHSWTVWNDCEAKLIESIKVMMREDELDGDEYDL